jgi:hypothetical protein
MDIAFDSKGDYYVMNFWRESGSRAGGFDLLKLNRDLDIVSTLVKAPISVEARSEEFDKIPEFAVGQDDYLVMGFASNYTFKILSPVGETMKIITKKYDLVPIPDEVKKKAKEKNPGFLMEMPEHYQPFFDFFCDDSGRLFVLAPGEGVADSIYECDVFDPEGKFLCSIPIKLMPPFLIVLTSENLYLVDEDSEGNPVLRRYRISWKI